MQKKKKTWECEHGCNQDEALAKTGRGCIHLERLLGNSSGLFGTRFTPSGRHATDDTPESLYLEMEAAEQFNRASYEDEPLPVSDEDKFRTLLAAYGLSEIKIDVLVARLVRGATFNEIAREFGYSDPGTAGRAFRDALEIFKRGKRQ